MSIHSSIVLRVNSSDSTTFYARQLLGGRDFAASDPLARQMVNFSYLLGDTATRECVMIDPAYAVDDLLAIAEADGMTVVGALASHYHADHVGGSMMGHTIEGISALLDKLDVPVHVNVNEVPWVKRTTGVDDSSLIAHDAGDVITVGSLSITCLHTPGHTPGSQCFLANGCLFSGDTLFLEGCGRTDLPGSNPEDMYHSLSQLAALPDETIVLPGHQYSVPPAAQLGEVKNFNYVFKPRTREAWMTMFGHD